MKILSVSTLDSSASASSTQVFGQSSSNFSLLEAKLAGIWQEVLGISPSSPENNFFELGGNSLSATQMVARIRALFEVDFPIQDFFLAPTLVGMAAKLEHLIQYKTLFVPPVITPISRDRELPLSFSQERMWFIHQLDPQSTAYSVVGAVRLKGKFVLTAMEQSLHELIKRHESLRTNFPAIDGRPIQRIAPSLELPIKQFDLCEAPAGEQEAWAKQILTTEASQPFDIENDPLLRVGIIKIRETEHILLLNLHHLITDGWSMTVFGRELMEIYKALSTGSVPNLPPLKIQFADYAYWQRQWFQGDVLETHLAYWRRQLADLTPLNLPTDHPRPLVQTYNGSFVAAQLDENLLADVRALANAEGVTPFMIELAIFQVLLYRYTGQTDLVVGTPIANREWLQSESLIGSLVTTLALRANLTGDPTFREFLRRVRETTLEAYTYQSLPFARLVAELNPTRDTSYSPLAQVMFNVINVPMPSFDLGEMEFEQIEVDRAGTQFDLGFTLVDMSLQKSIRVEYNQDLFDRATIERMLGHYLELLRAVVRNPDHSIAKLPLLSTAEKHLLLEERNATGRAFNLDQTLVQAFETQVEKTPYATALFFTENAYTYSELNAWSNQLARYLIQKGIKPAARVGLYLHRSYDTVAAILAILKAGATYVPLDPDYPLQRLEFMVQDADLTAIIASSETAELAHKLCPLGSQVIDLATEKEAIKAQASNKLVSLDKANTPAYIIYTSGSTGRPKGVIGTQQGVLNRAAWMWRVYPFETGEVLCHKTSLNFIDAVWEIFGPLLRGIPAVILPASSVKDPDVLVKTLSSYRVSRITLVPSLLKVILETHPGLGKELLALRLVVSSGEVLPAPLAHRFRGIVPQARLLNLYGSSEASGDSTYYEVTNQSPHDFIPLGNPMDNVELYILDAQLQLVPLGIPGELYIGGVGLALGYLNQPELTEERFLTNPFANGEKLYRTADWVRYLPDGNLQYLGRQDDQVKIRGMRVSTGEVVEGLKHYPGVVEAAVIVRQDQTGNNQLTGFVVPQKGTSIEMSQLRAFLTTHLPSHMVPARLENVEVLPLTPNGKLDKQALNRLVGATQAVASEPVAPSNDLEAQLLAIWQRLLELPAIGMTDDFFALGGHSLMAVRLTAEIEKEFGLKLPLSILFQTPTPARLAAYIQDWCKETALGTEIPYSPLVPIQPNGSQPPFFCVHGIGGSVLRYSALANFMGEDQPFYGLEALPGRSDKEVYGSVEALARYYIKAIQTIQPEGPYYLGGYSFGGTIAYEMAGQLTTQGHSIGLLGVFDFPAPKQGYEVPHVNLIFLGGLAKNLPNWWRDFVGFGIGGRLERIRRKLEAYTHLRRNKGKITLSYFEKDITQAPHEVQGLLKQLFQALVNYQPKPYAGKVAVFQASRQPLICSYDPTLCWDKLAKGGVDVYSIAGAHHNLIDEPQVQVLANCLRAAFKRK